jgi:hypothetical protein
VLRDDIGSAETNLRYELIDLWFSRATGEFDSRSLDVDILDRWA